MKAYKYFK